MRRGEKKKKKRFSSGFGPGPNLFGGHFLKKKEILKGKRCWLITKKKKKKKLSSYLGGGKHLEKAGGRGGGPEGVAL